MTYSVQWVRLDHPVIQDLHLLGISEFEFHLNLIFRSSIKQEYMEYFED